MEVTIASQVEKLSSASYSEKQIVYLIAKDWWDKWSAHEGYKCAANGPAPGPIDNSALLPEDAASSEAQGYPVYHFKPTIREGLVQNSDFFVVNKEIWDLLKGKYGVATHVAETETHEIKRRVVGGRGLNGDKTAVEVYPLCRARLFFKRGDGLSQPYFVEFKREVGLSCASTLESLRSRICQLAGGFADSAEIFMVSVGASMAAHAFTTINLDSDQSQTIGQLAKRKSSSGGGVSLDIAVVQFGEGEAGPEEAEEAEEEAAVGGGAVGVDPPDSDPEDAMADDDLTAAPILPSTSGYTPPNGPLRGRETTPVGGADGPAASGGSGGATPPAYGPSLPAQTNTLTSYYNKNSNVVTSKGGYGGGGSWSTRDDVYDAKGRPPGVSGLSNLGNTCFMNSSLQCLGHTEPLVRFFLSGGYEADVNETNPLGCGGKLARSFGSLLQSMWRGDVSHVSPKGFKSNLGEFAPQFSGYRQQDSQELLAFLLDGLHEDLNRVRQKPYVEEKEAGGRPDEVVAAETWDDYRRRNDSFFVDRFQGLLKSRLDCPRCQLSSIKFDPFQYLALQLPGSDTRIIEVAVIDVPAPGSPLPYSFHPGPGRGAAAAAAVYPTAPLQVLRAAVKVSAHGIIQDIINCLGEELDGVGEEEHSKGSGYVYTVTEFWQGNVQRHYTPEDPLSEIGTSDYIRVFRQREGAGVTREGTGSFAYLTMRGVGDSHSWKGSGEGLVSPVVVRLPRWKLPDGWDDEAAAALKEGMQGDEAFLMSVLDNIVAGLTGVATSRDAASASASASAQAESDTAMPSIFGPHPHAPMDLSGPGPLVPAPRPPLSAAAAAAAAAEVARIRYRLVRYPEYKYNGSAEVGSDQSYDRKYIQSETKPSSYNIKFAPQRQCLDVHWHTAKPDPHEYRPASPSEAANADANGGPYSDDASQGRAAAAAFASASAPAPAPGAYLLPSSHVPRAALSDTVLSAVGSVLQPLEHPSYVSLVKEAKGKEERVTLAQVLDNFTHPERLGTNDQWRCPRCKDFVQAEKKLDLWQLPEVLVVMLKRFSYTSTSRDKIDMQVDFPLVGLDMSPWCRGPQAAPPKYDCFAVSNHYGGLGGGHYTAHAKVPPNDRWYYFDDSRATLVTGNETDEVVTPAAYVLFYRRRAEAEADLATRSEEEVPGRKRMEDGAGGDGAVPGPSGNYGYGSGVNGFSGAPYAPLDGPGSTQAFGFGSQWAAGGTTPVLGRSDAFASDPFGQHRSGGGGGGGGARHSSPVGSGGAAGAAGHAGQASGSGMVVSGTLAGLHQYGSRSNSEGPGSSHGAASGGSGRSALDGEGFSGGPVDYELQGEQRFGYDSEAVLGPAADADWGLGPETEVAMVTEGIVRPDELEEVGGEGGGPADYEEAFAMGEH